MEKRALVISGGGAKGAWGGGALQYMIEELYYDWDLFYGTSTGSLLITLTSLGEMQKLKECYTSVNNDSIFSVKPFTKKGKLNIFNAIWRFINCETSLGEADGLKDLLYEMFTESDFQATINENKKLHACITNYRTGCIEFKNNFTTSYDDYIDYTLASTSVPLAMDFVRKNGELYLDGGVMEHIPLQKAIDDGADEIDVIILRPEYYDIEKWNPDNMFDVMMRTIDLMQKEISTSDVLIGKLKAADKEVVLNFYYTPYNLTNNSLVFDKEQMLKWWKEGYEYIKENGSNKSFLLNSTGYKTIKI